MNEAAHPGSPSTALAAPKRSGDSAERIFVQLTEDILSGNLAAGEKLNEPQLARRFGTSRSPVREAIRRLMERQLVLHQPNSGARVARFSPDRIIELYEIREVLEGLAARLAATKLDRVKLAEIEDILRFQQTCWDNRDPQDTRYLEANSEFHRVIRNSSGNQVLIAQLEDAWHKLPTLWRLQKTDQSPRGQGAIDEHWQVLFALKRRDGELAEIQMRRHIATTRRRYQNLMNMTQDDSFER